MPEDQILAAGDVIQGWEEVREAQYISAAQAWENLRQIILRGWRSWQRDLQTTIRCPVPPPMRYFSIILRNRIKSWSVWKAWKA